LVLSRFRPRTVLKSGVTAGRFSSVLRSALVVLQFAILIGFIVMTFTVSRQTSYALNRGQKLDVERVYVMQRACADAMLDAIKPLPGVAGTSCSNGQVLGRGRNASGIVLKDGTQLTIDIGPVGYDFFELYGIQPLEGRTFQRDRADQQPNPPPTEPGTPPTPLTSFTWPIIVNETLARKIDSSSPTAAVGQSVHFNVGGAKEGQSEIIGIVPDFAVDVAHQVVPPTVYFMMPASNIAQFGLLSVKLRADADEKATLDAIDKIWKEIGPARPVSRFAMKDSLAELNADIVRQSELFASFSVIAVFIAALGLFGLSAFTAERRTKEIGLRKALGSDRPPIVRLLMWQFTKPVLWANLIAWPAGYYVVNRWLSGFAYHVDVEFAVFLIASLVALLIAWATILGYSYKVSGAKPATALRYE
jgi:putative ABC transport system permease protein